MIGIVNAIILSLGTILNNVLGLLPSSPFQHVLAVDNIYLKYINYILPVNAAVAHLQLFLSAVVTYYGVRIVLRWIKAVGN